VPNVGQASRLSISLEKRKGINQMGKSYKDVGVDINLADHIVKINMIV
jgi:hypothetical protein